MNEENERICVELNEEDVQEIVDCYEKDIKYIKQLEQENIELKKEFKKLKSEIFWLKQENIDKNECIEAYLSMLDERDNRIDKAIEYIETYIDFEDSSKLDTKKELKELSDILKGGNNE